LAGGNLLLLAGHTPAAGPSGAQVLLQGVVVGGGGPQAGRRAGGGNSQAPCAQKKLPEVHRSQGGGGLNDSSGSDWTLAPATRIRACDRSRTPAYQSNDRWLPASRQSDRCIQRCVADELFHRRGWQLTAAVCVMCGGRIREARERVNVDFGRFLRISRIGG